MNFVKSAGNIKDCSDISTELKVIEKAICPVWIPSGICDSTVTYVCNLALKAWKAGGDKISPKKVCESISLCSSSLSSRILGANYKVMGEANWLQLAFHNLGKTSITVKNLDLKWGKIYDCAKPYDEISFKEFNIASGQVGSICATGREASPSGSEIYVDLYDGSTKIGTVYATCPFSGSNKVSYTPDS